MTDGLMRAWQSVLRDAICGPLLIPNIPGLKRLVIKC